MIAITEEKANLMFEEGCEIWVYTGDYGDMPLFEYELDEDGEEIIADEHRLMHPKSLDYGDKLEDLQGYNNYYVPE